MTKLWMLRRLKEMGANKSMLLDLYEKQIRSLLEYAAPAWHPGLYKVDHEVESHNMMSHSRQTDGEIALYHT